MGLGDITRNILTTFKADTSDLKQKVRELTGEEKKLAQAQLEAANARNDALEKWEKGLDKVNKALGVVQFAYEGFLDGVQDDRLQAVLDKNGASLDRLKDAAGGLVRENDLLARAAKELNGAFKNTPQDVELGERAILSLTRTTGDAGKAAAAVQDALVNLKVRGLQDLGVYVDTSKVKMDEAGNVLDNYQNKLELHQRILEALGAKANEAAGQQASVGESVQKSAVKIQDAFDDVKKALGQLVQAMAPLLEALAGAVGLIAKIAGSVPGGGAAIGGAAIGAQLGGGWGALVGGGLGGAMGLGNYIENDLDIGGGLFTTEEAGQQFADMVFRGGRSAYQVGLETKANAAGTHALDMLSARLRGGSIEGALRDGAQMYIGGILAGFTRTGQLFKAKQGKAGKGGSSTPGRIDLNFSDDLIAQLESEIANESGAPALARALDTGGMGDHFNALFDQAGLDLSKLQEGLTRESRYSAFQTKQDKTLLESIFGSRDEHETARELWGATSTVVASAFQALVTGSDSVGHAIKKALQGELLALGTKYSVLAIGSAAEAIYALAHYDFAAARNYGLAALKFGAAAAAAGIGAAALGGGGSSGGGGATASAGGGGTSAGGAPAAGPVTQVFITSNPFSPRDTPRMRRNNVEQLLEESLPGPGVKFS